MCTRADAFVLLRRACLRSGAMDKGGGGRLKCFCNVFD